LHAQLQIGGDIGGAGEFLGAEQRRGDGIDLGFQIRYCLSDRISSVFCALTCDGGPSLV